MEFIVITKSRKRVDIRCNAILLLGSAFLALTVMTGGVFYLGSEYGIEISKDKVTQFYQQANQAWTDEIKQQRLALDEARDTAEKHLDAMATRLSRLQAHVLRLNALGSRMAKMADLDELEFESLTNPGIGGPSPRLEQRNTIPDFLIDLDQLALKIEDRGDKLLAMESLLIDRSLRSETLPQGTPLASGWISSVFGWRNDPITGKKEFHEGLDFAGRSGSEVTAAGAGIVTWSDRRSGYGHLVEIKHGNGYVTRYAHNKKNMVLVGEKVEKGQVIAIIGSSGRSTGLHVHFEVLHNGKHVNPKKFIASSK